MPPLADPKQIRFDDATLFTDDNDHNPVVRAICPDCKGAARICVQHGPLHGDGFCATCHGVGSLDRPGRLFDNDAPPESVTPNQHGYLKCPGCGVAFRAIPPAPNVWTGWRHKCGQRIRLRLPE
jgi:hypothetical protein